MSRVLARMHSTPVEREYPLTQEKKRLVTAMHEGIPA